jgi:hypothetical protein
MGEVARPWAKSKNRSGALEERLAWRSLVLGITFLAI